jgi:acyl-CoA synthetase (AMP-forming)/AMP-acid ligase II
MSLLPAAKIFFQWRLKRTSWKINLQDAAVIGIPDERLGEIVAAVLKVKPGATP